MSKASEWAAVKPKPFGAPNLYAVVHQGGGLQINAAGVSPIGPTITPEIACEFARWILDTFGETS